MPGLAARDQIKTSSSRPVNEGVAGAGHASLLEEPRHLGRWYAWTREVEKALPT